MPDRPSKPSDEKAESPGEPGPVEAGSEQSLIGRLAKRIANKNTRPVLFRMVAARIRSRLLSENEAEVIAGWFDRIAEGEPPKEVFTPSVGRPRGKTNMRGPMANGEIPDDIDVAWIVRQNLAIARESGIRPGVVYAGVAKALKMKPGTVRNIYSRLKGEIG